MVNEKVEQTAEVEQEVKQIAEPEGVEGQVYDLHCKVPREMQGYLKDAAQLAYKMKVLANLTWLTS